MAEGTPIGALAVRIGADADQLISELKKADKALASTGDRFDAASKIATRFATVAAAVGAAIFAVVKSAANAADELGKLSQKVGVSVESLSALKYAAQLSDVSLDQLSTGLKQLSKHMAENGMHGKSVEEEFLRIAQEFERMEDGAGKTALAMKYFGKSGADLIPLLNQGRAGIEEMRKEAERLGIVMSKEAAKAAEEFNDNLTKLAATAEGLKIAFAGPLIKSLAEFTAQMLEGMKIAGSFGEALRLFGLGLSPFADIRDQIKGLNEEIDTLEKKRAGAGRMGFGAGRLSVVDEQIADAKKKLKFVQFLHEQQTKDLGPGGAMDMGVGLGDVFNPKKKPPPVEDSELAKRQQAEREFIGRQLQEALEEEQQIQLEAWAVMADLRKQELDREKGFVDERMRILMEYHDREQDEAIRQGEELLRIEQEREARLTALGFKHRQMNLAASKTFFDSMSVLMNTNSKKMFEIGKTAAIASTVINTYEMAVKSYNALASIPYVGPALGATAAAAALAYGMAQVSAIRAQSFGGGGGAGGAAPVVPASPVTGQPTGTPGGDVGPGRGGQTTVIHMHGETFGRKQLRALIDQINEEGRGSGRIVLAGA